MALSNICSASKFFNLPFSTLSARSLFASDDSILAFASVKGRLTNTVTPTNVSCPVTSLLLLQYRSDLLVRKSLFFHLSVLLLSGHYIFLEEF